MMTDPIEQLFETIIETIQSESQAPEELATAVCNAIVAKSELVEVLKTDRRMVQINQGNASGYQVLVEDGVAYIGTHYQIDCNTLKSLLEIVLRRVFQAPVGIPQNLPHRGAPKFVGRDRELATLHEQLQQNDRLAIASVQGMGGVGKTELALQYGLKHLPLGTYPGGVCWLRSREDVGSQILEFARRQLSLEPPEELELVGRVEYCWRHWQAGDVLAIFDDVQNYEDIQSYFPPVESRFKVLMTTRSRIGASVCELELDVLSKDAALDLLREIVRIDRIESQLADAEALCEWLGYLPLGLELVGRYLARNQTLTLEKMHQRLNEKRLAAKGLIKHDVGMTTTHVSLAAAFEVSWEDLGHNSVLAKPTGKCARQLGALLSLFAVAPIAWNWVLACLPDCDEEDLEAARDEGLIDFHLLQVNGDNTYQLHPSIKEFLMVKCDEIRVKENFQKIFREVILSEAAKSSQIPERSLMLESSSLIPHIQELIDRSNKTGSKENLEEELGCLGILYTSTGQYKNAETILLQAIYINEQLGLERPQATDNINNLAILYELIGRYEEAESLHLESLTMCKKYLFADRSIIANCMNNLGCLYESMGRYEEAASIHLKSLAIWEKTLSIDNPKIGTSLNNLAAIYKLMGRYQEAESLYIRSISISESQLGLDHLNTGSSLNNLALLYISTGRYDDAEPLLIKSISISEKHLGLNHKDNALYLNNLASLYLSVDRYDDAEPLLIRSLAIREHQLGVNHPDTAQSLHNLASLYDSTDRKIAAESLFLKSIFIKESQLGSDHPDTITSLDNLASLYLSVGRYIEAEPLLVRSLDIKRQQLGIDHPDAIKTSHNLALLYYKMNRYNDVEPLLVHLLSIKEQQLGVNYLETAKVVNNLATLCEVMLRPKEAESLYLKALAIYEIQLGKNNHKTAQIVENLANLYWATEQYQKTILFVVRLLAIKEQQMGSHHLETARILNNLATLYDLTGMKKAAEALYIRSLNIFEEQLGDCHSSTKTIKEGLERLQANMLDRDT